MYDAASRVGLVAPDERGGRLDVRDHVAGQVARARARIGEDLVLVVAALRRAERAARGEAEAVVRLALQRGQVVEQRRLLLLRGLVELRDLAPPARDRGDDRRRAPRRSRCGPRARGTTRPSARSRGPRRRARRSASKRASTSQYFCGTKARISSSRRVMIASVGVCTRPSETAPSNEERRRIVAARVAFIPTIQSASERERAACSSERMLVAVAQALEALADRRLGHRVQPQPLDGQLRAGLLVEVGEDQLALAAGVAGVDDEVVVVAA